MNFRLLRTTPDSSTLVKSLCPGVAKSKLPIVFLDSILHSRDTGETLRPTLGAMINQKHCPYCHSPTARECSHLALAAEGRDFVRRCIEQCHGEIPWRILCQQRQSSGWSVQQEDFTWLETAFCEQFLKHLNWYGIMDHEWRTGPKPGQGGFWVLLWSKNPQRLWWELREDLERRTVRAPLAQEPPPWLIFLNPQ